MATALLATRNAMEFLIHLFKLQIYWKFQRC